VASQRAHHGTTAANEAIVIAGANIDRKDRRALGAANTLEAFVPIGGLPLFKH
jgi:hypothetical protein